MQGCNSDAVIEKVGVGDDYVNSSNSQNHSPQVALRRELTMELLYLLFPRLGSIVRH